MLDIDQVVPGGISLDAVQDHWLVREMFREPVGGWLGWGVLTVAVVSIAYESYLGNLWLIPLVVIPLAEVYPAGDPETAGWLRLAGVCYMVLAGIGLVAIQVIA